MINIDSVYCQSLSGATFSICTILGSCDTGGFMLLQLIFFFFFICV